MSVSFAFVLLLVGGIAVLGVGLLVVLGLLLHRGASVGRG